jgi:hypothetical protein
MNSYLEGRGLSKHISDTQNKMCVFYQINNTVGAYMCMLSVPCVKLAESLLQWNQINERA